MSQDFRGRREVEWRVVAIKVSEKENKFDEKSPLNTARQKNGR